jgi:circadian clock protein KaiB
MRVQENAPCPPPVLPPKAGQSTFPSGKETSDLSKYLLKLYITGSSPRAEAAIRNLRRICEDELNGRYELEIIDVLENAEAAETDRVLATPTLIKQLPPPLRRVIGDLSDREKVLLGLEVRPRDDDTPSK